MTGSNPGFVHVYLIHSWLASCLDIACTFMRLRLFLSLISENCSFVQVSKICHVLASCSHVLRSSFLEPNPLDISNNSQPLSLILLRLVQERSTHLGKQSPLAIFESRLFHTPFLHTVGTQHTHVTMAALHAWVGPTRLTAADMSLFSFPPSLWLGGAAVTHESRVCSPVV